ncbi:MAG: nicotinamide N-methyltransferase [Pyrinomonadaceae bacterium]|jgi:SAM-dependent methyltransferase|nr:nicotinamide N-methyltransferase [Pyrinomonadaceae bacterium]
MLEFPTRQYLSEYYQCLDFENYALMSFLHRAYSFIGKRQRLVDIGSGPTIYQFMSASRDINEIVASDPLLSNRREILSWLAEDSDAYNWDDFINYAAVLEKKEGSLEDSQHIKGRMRKRITSVVPCDIHNEEPLFIPVEELFDVASSHFCLESATETFDEFLYCLRNILRIITPDGFFIASLLKEASSYTIGDTWLPSLAVNETLVEELFKASGLVLLGSETITVEAQRGYEGIILCLSKKICN